jgi:hypothetical protein
VSIVQQAYSQMMLRQVVPALREMGFTGARQMFKYRGGRGEAWFSIQKDGRFTRHQRLSFTVNGPWWGSGRICELMPQGAIDTWWTIDGPQADQVAGSFIAAISRYVMPALRARLEEPVALRAADVVWQRTFPEVPDLPERQPDGGGAEPALPFVQPAGSPLDRHFADFSSGIALLRLQVGEYVAERGMNDPRTVPALLDRLEHDPSPWIRTAVAGRMLTIVAHQERVRPALRAAAAADEMALVRYAARYALRADLGGTSN